MFLIPFGLVIIGSILSWWRAHLKSLPPKESYAAKVMSIDKDGDGLLSMEEASLVKKENMGVKLLTSTIGFKLLVIMLKLAVVLTIGAAFVKCNPMQQSYLKEDDEYDDDDKIPDYKGRTVRMKSDTVQMCTPIFLRALLATIGPHMDRIILFCSRHCD